MELVHRKEFIFRHSFHKLPYISRVRNHQIPFLCIIRIPSLQIGQFLALGKSAAGIQIVEKGLYIHGD